ncbi:MAG: NAD(P)H-binding protein [Gammaproteobacteria bacterium]
MKKAAGRTALVAGATGLIGRRLLSVLADAGNYAAIHALLRRPANLPVPVIPQIVDFADLSLHAEAIGPLDDVYCALGTTIRKAGSQQAFRRVDHDHVLAVGQLAKQLGARCMLVVSSLGADTDARGFYLRVKGEAEADLERLVLPGLAVFRPSLLQGPRDEFRLGEEVGNVAMKIFAPLVPNRYKPVSDRVLASAMLAVAQAGVSGVRVIESEEIQRLGSGRSGSA